MTTDQTSFDISPEQMAKRLSHRPKERMAYFRQLPITERSAVFNILSPHVRQQILNKLSINEAVEILDHLDLRRAHHILDRMKNNKRRKNIVGKLKNELHGKIEYFLQFHPQTSHALIHLNYVLLSEKTTIGETASIIEDYVHNTGKIPEVLVSQNGKMIGEVPLNTLVRERNSSRLGSYVRKIKTISYTAKHQEVIRLFSAKSHSKIVVLDHDESVIGIVYSDDVMDLLEKSPASSLYSFAGVEESERPFDDVKSKVRHRYKWLILNLATAFLAAGVVASFEDTLSQIVLLAIYMPVISGMGGNAVTQTLAIIVRGIAIGEISLKNSKPAIVREMSAGLINGVITGIIVTIVALIFNQDLLFGLVVGLTLVISLVVAGLTGTIIPLILKQFGKDPATSATIFITTATDVIGLFVLLGLAQMILV